MKTKKPKLGLQPTNSGVQRYITKDEVEKKRCLKSQAENRCKYAKNKCQTEFSKLFEHWKNAKNEKSKRKKKRTLRAFANKGPYQKEIYLNKFPNEKNKENKDVWTKLRTATNIKPYQGGLPS